MARVPPMRRDPPILRLVRALLMALLASVATLAPAHGLRASASVVDADRAPVRQTDHGRGPAASER